MRSVIQIDDDRCFVCQMAMGTEWHHLFPGVPNRKLSEQDGMKILVCRHCHDELHFGKKSGELMDKYQRLGQEKWEAFYGPGLLLQGKSPRDEFIHRYGRNWL